jgi:hypothetical protein
MNPLAQNPGFYQDLERRITMRIGDNEQIDANFVGRICVACLVTPLSGMRSAYQNAVPPPFERGRILIRKKQNSKPEPASRSL